jgi:hypothetical protein
MCVDFNRVNIRLCTCTIDGFDVSAGVILKPNYTVDRIARVRKSTRRLFLNLLQSNSAVTMGRWDANDITAVCTMGLLVYVVLHHASTPQMHDPKAICKSPHAVTLLP